MREEHCRSKIEQSAEVKRIRYQHHYHHRYHCRRHHYFVLAHSFRFHCQLLNFPHDDDVWFFFHSPWQRLMMKIMMMMMMTMTKTNETRKKLMFRLADLKTI